jgi:group I intron endonuclease
MVDCCIIYLIKNSVNDKVYVGQTWDSTNRRWHGGGGYKGCIYINNAIEKYGKDNFYYINLDFAFTQAQANILEDFYIDKYDSTNPEKGYNIKRGGSNGKLTEEIKAKISASLKGNVISLETREKISKANMGKKHTEESKIKISNSKIGDKHPLYNKHISDEWKNNIIIGCEGINATLTSEQVLTIFNDRRIQIDIAKEYNIDQTTVSDIKKGKTWSYLTGKSYKPKPRLTKQQVISIYIDTREYEDIAKEYNMTISMIRLIKTDKAWKNITNKGKQ